MAETISDYRQLAEELLTSPTDGRWSHWNASGDSRAPRGYYFNLLQQDGRYQKVSPAEFIQTIIGPLQDPTLSQYDQHRQRVILRHVMDAEVELHMAGDLLNAFTTEVTKEVAHG